MSTGDGRRMGGPLLLLLALFSICHCQSVPEITTSVVEVSEDIQKDQYAFSIVASDPDGDTLTYSIENDVKKHFTVDANTGEVKINNPLDYEEQQILTVTAVVSDGDHDPTKKTINIVVVDANDNAPLFINTPYNEEVPENTPVQRTVLTVQATDPDSGSGGLVSYQISQVTPPDGADVFSISPNGGQIVLTQSLNYTHKSSFYQLKITASDGGGPLNGMENYVQSTITTAFITVKDIADIDPQFLNLPNLITLKEHSPVDGNAVFRVQARDPDMGINDEIVYSIEKSSTPDLFQIDSVTGEVTVLTDIDREALVDGTSVVALTVKATEKNLNVAGVYASTTAVLDIRIEDVNDNPPEFFRCEKENDCVEENNFSGEVDEHSSVNLPVIGLNMRVKDKDEGENSRFSLSLEGPHKDAFSVSPVNDMSDRPVQILIRNPQAVDYEKDKIITVEVVATDSTKPEFVATATVTIRVNDINDNFPEFEEDVYKLSVEEHCADGTIIDTVTATDADTLDVGNLTYRLLPESMLAYFDVFPHNGTIYVKDGASLDWERRSSFSPTLQARDLALNPGSTVLEITIVDINDQAPKFLRDYEVFILENNVFQFQVEARDDDDPESDNSKIEYKLMPTPYSNNFTIDKDTGQISSKITLDREAIEPEEKGVIKLNVTATDKGKEPLSTSVEVKINVDDENDNTPVYKDTEYTFHVNESEKGAFVGYIFARDGDQTEYNNRTSFRITGGGGGTFLCISEAFEDGYRGRVLVDPEVELDFESEQNKYTLKIEASDLGGNSAECTVNVVVDDLNDTPPEFPTNLVMRAKENLPPWKDIAMILGKDVDKGHKLEYKLVSLECRCNGTWGECEKEWFMVHTTGSVMTGESPTIDYEECDLVKMKALVVDVNTQVKRNSTEGEIMIEIEDVNDNPPKFTPVQEFFVIITESVSEDKVVARVYAEDIDTGEHKKIVFQVASVSFASINPEEGTTPESASLFKAETDPPDNKGNYMGVIKATRTLDQNKKGKYLVTVMAQNGELNTNETVELITVDQSYRVILRFQSAIDEVNYNLPGIRAALTGATKTMVHVVKVAPDFDNRRQRNDKAEREVVTIMEAYFVFPNGTALDSDTVSRILNSQTIYEEYGVVLQQYGLLGITGTPETTTEPKVELYITIGLVALLVIVLASMTTALVCIRRKYQTKLKAAKAMNTAAMVSSEENRDGPVVPGTNKYNRDGANPVLNLNIDSTTDLGFDEEASSAERESLSSLDYSEGGADQDGNLMAMGVINEESESDVEPLGAALAQRGRKKNSDTPSVTFNNPLADTTDL